MRRWCGACGRLYDDVDQWTICPHGPLWAASSAYDPDTDTIRGFNHPDDIAIDVAPRWRAFDRWWHFLLYYLACFAIGLLLGWWCS